MYICFLLVTMICQVAANDVPISAISTMTTQLHIWSKAPVVPVVPCKGLLQHGGSQCVVNQLKTTCFMLQVLYTQHNALKSDLAITTLKSSACIL